MVRPLGWTFCENFIHVIKFSKFPGLKVTKCTWLDSGNYDWCFLNNILSNQQFTFYFSELIHWSYCHWRPGQEHDGPKGNGQDLSQYGAGWLPWRYSGGIVAYNTNNFNKTHIYRGIRGEGKTPVNRVRGFVCMYLPTSCTSCQLLMEIQLDHLL